MTMMTGVGKPWPPEPLERDAPRVPGNAGLIDRHHKRSTLEREHFLPLLTGEVLVRLGIVDRQEFHAAGLEARREPAHGR